MTLTVKNSKIYKIKSRSGGIGRRAGLKIRWTLKSVRVRIPPPALKKEENVIKKDFVESISEKTGLNKTVVKKVIDEFLESLKQAFIEGKRVELRNFGVFLVKRRKPKIGRNPKTGEIYNIPERTKIIFKQSKIFKKMEKE